MILTNDTTSQARQRLLDYVAKGRDPHGRKYKSNTMVLIAGGSGQETITVQLYATPILTFGPDGTITLDSGGWHTPTTKDRLNEFLPSGFRVSQLRGEWYLHDAKDTFNWADGMTIDPDGTVRGYALPEQVKARSKLRKRIRAYCRKAEEALRAGEVEDPNRGDCFFCQMRVVGSGVPLGEDTRDTSHLESHMEEDYIVPSLLWRAVETGGRGNPSMVWVMREDVADLIARDLRYYLYEQFGLQRRTGGLRWTE